MSSPISELAKPTNSLFHTPENFTIELTGLYYRKNCPSNDFLINVIEI
jgi:hypothetical protein